MVGDIISERGEELSRNGGRHHSGIVGGFSRNPHASGPRRKHRVDTSHLTTATIPGSRLTVHSGGVHPMVYREMRGDWITNQSRSHTPLGRLPLLHASAVQAVVMRYESGSPDPKGRLALTPFETAWRKLMRPASAKRFQRQCVGSGTASIASAYGAPPTGRFGMFFLGLLFGRRRSFATSGMKVH
jgi:hypothetical protein